MKKYKLFSRASYFTIITLILIVFTSLWIGCSEENTSPNITNSTSPLVSLSKINPQVQNVMAVQNRATKALMSHSEVVGTGTGLDSDGNLAIIVYTISKVEQKGNFELPAVANIRAFEVIPEKINGHKVITKVTGEFVARADPTARFARPVPIGVSTGHPDVTAGTIGCRIKDAVGNVYALSNNHVLANSNMAANGDNVIQPGSYDGGSSPNDVIGTLYDYEEILFDGSANYVDAAIALTTMGNVGTTTPSDGYGTPGTQVTAAYIGQQVQKYGRTTGWTHGVVQEINVTISVSYNGPVAIYEDQISITDGAFSAGGDSGSLIVTDDSNKNPVALLFAGGSNRTIGCPIHYALDRFNVTIDDRSGGGSGNNPPNADFTFTRNDLAADFTDQSTDSDGSVVSWNWDFDDGNTSTAQNPSHTYSSGGTYAVVLTITDDDGATDLISKNVTVSGGSAITLTASAYKSKGRISVSLNWSGASGSQVEIYRNGSLLTTTANDGSYTNATGQKRNISFVYKVCEIGGSPCSNEVTVRR